MSDPLNVSRVPVVISCELARHALSLEQARRLKPQDVIVADKLAGDCLDVRVNGRPFAQGEIVVVSDRLAVRLTRLVPLDREVAP